MAFRRNRRHICSEISGVDLNEDQRMTDTALPMNEMLFAAKPRLHSPLTGSSRARLIVESTFPRKM